MADVCILIQYLLYLCKIKAIFGFDKGCWFLLSKNLQFFKGSVDERRYKRSSESTEASRKETPILERSEKASLEEAELQMSLKDHFQIGRCKGGDPVSQGSRMCSSYKANASCSQETMMCLARKWVCEWQW